MKLKQYQSALETIESCLKIRPDSVQCLILKVECQHELRQFSLALITIEELLGIVQGVVRRGALLRKKAKLLS